MTFPTWPWQKKEKRETHIDMCPSDTTLSEEDLYMHKALEVLYLYDGHIKPMFQPLLLAYNGLECHALAPKKLLS